MKTLCAAFSFITLLFVGTPEASALTASQYQLNSGDLITIAVFGEEDMDVEARLTDAGTISYPFLGEIRVKGMTVGELQTFITGQLKGDYFVDPKIRVSIEEYRKFFVRGEVKSPGGFSFEPGLTLEKAIALAGGFTQRASKKQIMVTREENDRPIEHRLKLNEPVLPGDIVNVDESFF